MRIAARVAPRAKIARCMTRASSIPSTSSIVTEPTVMITVASRSRHHVVAVSTST
jgi:hypothetical protein